MSSADPAICTWGTDWQIQPAPSTLMSSTPSSQLINAKNWAQNKASPPSKSVRLPTTAISYALAINKAEGAFSRCPGWTICGTTGHNVVLIAYDANWNKLYSVRDYPWGVSNAPPAVQTQRSAVRFGGWQPNAGANSTCHARTNFECPFDTHVKCDPNFAPGGTSPCEQFLCGQTIPVVTFDQSPVDWYVCEAGAAACQDPWQADNGIWSAICTDSYKCTIAMGSDDTFVVALPADLRGGPNSNLSWAATNGL